MNDGVREGMCVGDGDMKESEGDEKGIEGKREKEKDEVVTGGRDLFILESCQEGSVSPVVKPFSRSFDSSATNHWQLVQQ